MKTLTFEEFVALNPAWLGNKEQIKSYFDRFGGRVSALDILKLDDVRPEDKLWTVLYEEFIPAPILQEFVCVCAEYVLSLIETHDPRSMKAIEVKRAWLRGEATELELSNAYTDACSDYKWTAARGIAMYAAMYGAMWAIIYNAAIETGWRAAELSDVDEAAVYEAQVAYLIMTLEEEV